MRFKGLISVAVVVTLLGSGCEMFGGKKDDNKGGSGGSGSTAGGGGGGGVDMTAYMTVISPMPGWPKDGNGITQGWWVSQKSTNAAGTSETKYSVIEVAGDDCKVEVSNPPGYKDYIWALKVKKSTGEVTYAGAGHKGEKPKDIKIQKSPTPAAGEAPTGTDESVTVKAGTFPAKKFVTKGGAGDVTTWVGTDGDTKDVMLKSAYSGGGDELAAAPAMEDWTCSGKTTKVKHLTYASGMEYWNLDAPWPFVGALAKMKMTGMSTEVTGTGTDAKPDLKWN